MGAQAKFIVLVKINTRICSKKRHARQCNATRSWHVNLSNAIKIWDSHGVASPSPSFHARFLSLALTEITASIAAWCELHDLL